MDISAALKVLLVSAIPFLELRIGIPMGIYNGLTPATSIGLGVLGNLVQVPLVIFLMHMLRRLAQQFKWAARWLSKIDRSAERHHAKVRRYGWLGIALFVGIPIPGTGLWSGAAITTLMRMPLYLTAIALSLGIVVSGLLVGAVSSGAFTVIRLLEN